MVNVRKDPSVLLFDVSDSSLWRYRHPFPVERTNVRSDDGFIDEAGNLCSLAVKKSCRSESHSFVE